MSAPARAARGPFDPGISLKATTLEAALGLLGAAMGVAFDRGQDLPAEAADAIEALALPAGLRSRRTMLDGEWWRDGRDPMVARVAERRRAPREPGTAFESPSLASGTGWVALIPVQDGYAMRAIGLDGAPVEWPVDARTAERLSPFAFAFHRCFERKALGARDVLRFALAPAQGDLGLLLGAGIGAALVGLLAPMATGWLVDHAIPSHAYGTIVLVLAGLGVAGLALVALDMLRTLAELRFEARAGVAMQAAIVDRVVSAPPAFFRAFSSGDLGMRIGAVNAVQRTLTSSAIGIFTTTLFLAANLAMMFAYSAALSLAALAVVAIVVGVSTRLGLERARIGPRIEALEGKVAAMTFELFAGIAKLRAGAAEGRALERWYSRYEELREANGAAARIANRETVLLAMLQPLATALVLSLAWHAMRGPAALTAGHFVAFHAALFGVLGAVQALVSAGLALAQLKPIWDRARPILEVLPENAAGGARHEPQGAIALEGVSFAYPGAEPALRGIDLAVRPGEFVAVVGPSGSGKSTLMRLLLGFEKPAAGTVRYDGHDLAELDAPWLRRRMGTVLQDGRLWAGDLYSNIAGASNAGVDAAWGAARRAGIAAEIDALPMGMYTVVGEGLATLSGGQRQRVLVARALVSEPRILLLDEATSALDGPAQAAVMESLAQLGATRIVIAHRLDTVRAADRIVVLERGRIVQQGTFRELAQRQGPFAALLARQVA